MAEEVGRLLEADAAGVIRFDEGDGVIVGGWTAGRLPEPPSITGSPCRRTRPPRGSIGRGARPASTATTVPESCTRRCARVGLRASVGAPVVVDGALWGAVSVGSMSATPFPVGAEARLAAFAELVAQALANADAREQLAASRKRLVEAAQVERRRLERKFHDRAQQRLVALAITLRPAERQLERDPVAARDSLHRASAEPADALAELREPARGPHPAVLTDHGLEAALTALTARAAVPVELTVDLDPRPPEAVEAAVYFIVAEALTNVARYASASTASVAVRREAGGVLVDATDDGKGGANPGAGTGLRGLMDRGRGARRATRRPQPARTRHDGPGLAPRN